MNGYTSGQLLALICFVIWGTWLSVYDLRFHRLPNPVVATITVILAVLAVFDSHRIQILWFAAAHFCIYLAMHVISKGSLGMGDVKYSLPVGLITGMFDVQLANLVWMTFVLAAIGSIGLVLANRRSWKSRIAFGPYMFVGALLSVLMSL